MAVTTSSEVAKYLILFSQEHGDPITNLKLQKLLYYAQGFFLALKNKPLFSEDFQAWVHGPVESKVYGNYKKYRWGEISASPKKPKFGKSVIRHLNEVMEVFGGYSAYQLERMTHQELPWLNARGNLPMDAPSKAIISKRDMKKYFRSIYEREEEGED